MNTEVNLYVYAVFPDKEIVPIGRILSRNLGNPGRYEGFFKYSPSYLSHPKAYPIDPVHLPLAEKVFSANNGETGIHAIFDDSLPDAWGRILLAKKGKLELKRYTPAHLLGALGSDGLGRFLFAEEEKTPDFHPESSSISFSDISTALEETRKHEKSIDTDSAELQHILACGSSAGGARPKVLTSRDNKLWIAKLSSIKDIHPKLFVALEEAGLLLASKAGLTIPEIHRCSVGNRDVLLVERFDTTNKGGRNAIVSFRTLIGQEDQYNISYSDLAAIASRYSHHPSHDLELLYRQMIVNVLLVNTDDHLQNFSMLHTSNGWQLSPSYDIVPNIYQTEQILMVNNKHSKIKFSDILAEGKKFGLTTQKCKSILDEIVENLADWEKIFDRCKVPLNHTETLRKEIQKRLSKKI